MSIVVRKPEILITLRQEVHRAVALLKERRSQVQEYLMSQQVLERPSKRRAIEGKKKLPEFSTKEKNQKGLAAGELIVDLLNEIYRNLTRINIFLQKCSQDEFYAHVGVIARYTDKVIAVLGGVEKQQLKYKDLEQQHLRRPGLFQKAYSEKLKQLATGVISKTAKGRDALMALVSPAIHKSK